MVVVCDLKEMSTDRTIIAHTFDSYLWVRCEGRGSFINSPALKSAAEGYLIKGGQNVVLDLEICQGVDSTFMGTIAGITKLCFARDGCMQIASPTPRTRAAMESLGLDMLVEMDPEEAAWRDNLTQIRAEVAAQAALKAAAPPEAPALSEIERTRHVLNAHQTLRGLNEQNEETFGYVCESLEQDLRQRESEQ